MKLREFLEQEQLSESKQDLENALKKVREIIRKPNSGMSREGKKECEMIIDSLLASVDDKAMFERYYNKFMAKNTDAMDFVLDEVYAQMKVKGYQEFEAKAFGIKEEKVIKDYEQWKAAVEKKYPEYKGKFQFKGRVEGGKATISAEIKGMDRSFGVWDDDKDEGVVLEAKETPLHLMPTGKLIKKFSKGAKFDFNNELQAHYGKPTRKIGDDRNVYYIKGGKLVAKYDPILDVGYIYEPQK
jgi:predicted Ser/Thr protein kinase